MTTWLLVCSRSSLAFGYVSAHISFFPRSFEMCSLPHKLSITQCPSFVSPVKLFRGSGPRTTPCKYHLFHPSMMKTEISRIHFVKPQRTSAHACTLHLSSAAIKGVWILLSPPIWRFIILSTGHPLSLTYLIPHVMMITSLPVLYPSRAVSYTSRFCFIYHFSLPFLALIKLSLGT